MNTFYLARGVVIRDERLLVMRSRGTAFTFLPGGHVETDDGERFTDALTREFREELGLDVECGDYLGAVAFRWPEAAPTEYEINQIFLVALPASAEVASQERDLVAEWIAVSDVAESDLEPAPLRQLIAAYAAGSRAPWWADA